MPSTAPRPSPAPLPVGARGIRRFTIGSRWLYGGDSRFDASSYAAGAIQALEAIEACPHEKRPLSTLVGTLWHPVQDQARSNFKRIYTSREHGVPFVGSREMFSLPVRPARFLSERMPKLGDLLIPEG